MPSVPNTFAPPGIEPRPFGTLTDDATHLAIQLPICTLSATCLRWRPNHKTKTGTKRPIATLLSVRSILS